MRLNHTHHRTVRIWTNIYDLVWYKDEGRLGEKGKRQWDKDEGRLDSKEQEIAEKG